MFFCIKKNLSLRERFSRRSYYSKARVNLLLKIDYRLMIKSINSTTPKSTTAKKAANSKTVTTTVFVYLDISLLVGQVTSFISSLTLFKKFTGFLTSFYGLFCLFVQCVFATVTAEFFNF